MLKVAATIFLSLVLGACSIVGFHDAYEQPRYTVVETVSDDVEIRRYAPRVAAETSVGSADADKGTREAFGLLFDYISGDNVPSLKIEMTSPVAVAEDDARIEVTQPVETRAPSGRMTMRFFLPSSLTEVTAPQPSDTRVRIVTLPEETVAALRYSGRRDGERAAEKMAALHDALATGEWRSAGEAVSYYYDPPWTLPWFRRNEAIVPVTRN
jgi:hypothetical protein